MQLRRCLQALGTTLPLLMSSTLGQDSPWQVTNLQTWSPSGRPGSNPDWYIHVNITSPDIPSSEVYCQIVWLYPNAPYNQILDCEVVDTSDSTTWAWTVELLEATDEDPYPTTNFDLRWRAAQTPRDPTDEDFGIWTGVGQFEIGKNMQGQCAASGFCSWALKPDSTPVSIDVNSIPCYGTVDEALHGSNCDENEAD
ncbi:hypothetical protein F5Y09DRAFT_295605 [Xylaria sp. FL1042]|nr:hypothetical protein F5Y09DRAFT_295605 [Xylaria sp. FL1042]